MASILGGRLEGNTLTFEVAEESLLGTERVSYRNRYEGTLSRGEITFTLDSDRPWGFPRQSFVMERPDAP